MLHRHIGKDLVAFCEGELKGELANRIEEHLLVCRRCRKEYEQVLRGVFLVKHLSRPAGSTLSWSEVERAIADGHDRAGHGVFDSTRRASFSWLGLKVFAVACLTLVLIGSFLYRSLLIQGRDRPSRREHSGCVARFPRCRRTGCFAGCRCGACSSAAAPGRLQPGTAVRASG